MTPLAHRITKELSSPKKSRSIKNLSEVSDFVRDVHCFEVSDIQAMVRDVCNSIDQPEVPDVAPDRRLAFLPAPRTWIEERGPRGLRVGYFLEEKAPGIAKCVTVVEYDNDSSASGRLGIFGDEIVLRDGDPSAATESQASYAHHLICGFLACINSPRIIGRHQHMPHRGLERALLKQQKLIGKFPLHAWTEIKLEVTPPEDARDDPSIEAHYTGKKALHFCRAHLRIVRGQLVFVKAHWRGDPALGMKQSRYKVVTPKGGA